MQRKFKGEMRASGVLVARLVQAGAIKAVPSSRLPLKKIIQFGFPNRRSDPEVNRWRVLNFSHLLRGLRKEMLARLQNILYASGALWIAKIEGGTGRVVPFGLASLRVVTTAGVNFLTDAMQGITEPEILKFHGIGTGTTAEAVGDTALVTELTTEYNPNSTRATGSLTEGAGANIFRTIGTNTLDSGTPAVTEHGIFSQAATGGGTLLDRSVFTAINLNGGNGDGLQTTYDLTFPSGG